MRLEAAYMMKWLDAGRGELNGLEFHISSQGLLWAKDLAGQIRAITVFEPRDLDQSFIQRLNARMSKPECAGFSFGLVLPPFIKHRADTLIKTEHKLELVFSPFAFVRCSKGVFSVRTRLRVVSIDDSAVLLKLLAHTMADMKFVDVIGQVSNPKEAVQTILSADPDVVTLDIQMPGMTGVEVLKNLLARKYYPVIMVSSLSMDEGSLVFDALNAGAFDYLPKPKLEERESFREELSERLIAAARGQAMKPLIKPSRRDTNAKTFDLRGVGKLIWCLGASTGGTQALTEVFRGLPAEIPPVLVVQHIPPIFSRAFANSLNELCPFTVKEAEHGETVKPNHVYIAAGGIQMGLVQQGNELKIELRDDVPVNRFKPSVDYLFADIAKLKGFQIVAGVLTGMGRDGAQGLLELKNRGARTFAQDEATSAVYGMPRAAFELGGAEVVASLDQIATTLMSHSVSHTERK